MSASHFALGDDEQFITCTQSGHEARRKARRKARIAFAVFLQFLLELRHQEMCVYKYGVKTKNHMSSDLIVFILAT